MGLVPRPWIAVNHIVFTPVEGLDAHQFEVVGVGDFLHELAALFSIFFLFLQALPAVVVRFILAFINELLDLLVFFSRVFVRKRFVVFGGQLLHLLAINLHHVISLHLGGLDLSFAVEMALFLAFHVGIVPLFLVVLEVIVGGPANQVADLVLG